MKIYAYIYICIYANSELVERSSSLKEEPELDPAAEGPCGTYRFLLAALSSLA